MKPNCLLIFYYLFGFLTCQTLIADTVDGTIPNQSYSPSEKWEIISPQMSDLHLNQPSVFNGYAVLAGNAEHEIWDISDPYSPFRISTMLSMYDSGEAEAHQVTYAKDSSGNYYFCTNSGKGIDIWNISDAANPVYVSALVLPGINYGDVSGAVWGVSWQGDYIYVGATTKGIYVVDASDPANPSHVATFSKSELGGVTSGPLFALGDLLVVTSPKDHAGIATVDISNPLSPKLLDAVDDASPNSYIGGFYGKNAHLITPFRSYDVTSDPRNITEIDSGLDIESEYVSFSDDYLFLGGLREGTQGIWKYDISDVSNPIFVGRVKGRDSRWDDQFSCPIGNLILIADDQRVNSQYVGAVIAVQDTEPDSLPPTVKWVSPENGSSNQTLSGQIALSLSEWPELKSLDPSKMTLRPQGGSPISGVWSTTATVLNFVSDTSLNPFTRYEINLEAGSFTDLVGNSFGSDFTSTFVTGSVNQNEDWQSGCIPDPVIGDLYNLVGELSSFEIDDPSSNSTYVWEMGDEISLSGDSISHTYSSPGRYFIQMTETHSRLEEFIVEAESANYEGGVNTEANWEGFSGIGYADYPSAEGSDVKVSWEIDLPQAELVGISFQYALGRTPARPVNLYINGDFVETLNLEYTGDWDSWESSATNTIQLPAGSHTIDLVADAGSQGPNVDFLKYAFLEESGATNQVPRELVTINRVSFLHIVHNPLTENLPRSSTAIIENAPDVWTVNPDADTVTVLNGTTFNVISEIPVGSEPKSIAKAPDGTIWVACRKSWEIKVIDSTSYSVIDTIALPYASRPLGLVFSPDESAAFVSLEALGQLLKIDPTTRSISSSLDLGPDNDGCIPKVRGIAVNADSNKVFLTRFISPDTAGEVYVIDPSSMSLRNTITLPLSSGTDEAQFARGLPNYLTSITISPDGTRAWVPSKKDNIERGGALDGQPLEHDRVVRAITSAIDPVNETHIMAERLDLDNSDRCHSVTFSAKGDLSFITLPGNNEIKVLNAYNGSEVTTINTENVPEAIVIDSSSNLLYAKNFLSRSVSVYNISDLLGCGSTAALIGHFSTVGSEPLAADVLRGKQLFYDAKSDSLNMDGYMSCASCHLDGGHDGRTWDFTAPMSEGFRNTIDLRGRSGNAHGRLHWSGNFDEVHDFEGQIRELGEGAGLMNSSDFYSGTYANPLGQPKSGLSTDLDALASYVSSLNEVPRSPYRNQDGSLTADASAGKALFNSMRCFDCHGGEHYTDSPLGTLHDVGTLQVTSGQRLGGTLSGLDTPTLRGVWDTAPYLHDGSAKSLKEVLTTKNSTGEHASLSDLNDTEVDQIVAYLTQVDDIEPAASPYTGIGATTYDSFIANTSLTGASADENADPDGDGWPNITEFIMGGSNPENSAEVPDCASIHVREIADDYLQFSWLKREGGIWLDGNTYQWDDILTTPLGSIDLANWSEQMITIQNPPGLPAPPANYQWTTSRIYRPITMEPRAFIKMGVELKNP